MEKRLIDANEIFDKVEANYRMSEGVRHECEREFLNLICEQPTVDAVPVVRCKECKRWGCPIPIEMKEKGYGYCCALWTNTHENDYCAWGERKE